MTLINHWSFDNNYLDLKSGSPLSIKNTSFTKDRFGQENFAVLFSFGRIRIPGFFFRGTFSVLAWIYIVNVDASEQRLLYCLGQNKTDSLLFTLQSGNGKYSYFAVNDQNKLQVSHKLPTRTWIHVGATLDYNKVANIWFNGTSVKSVVFRNFPENLTWSECYIGYTSDNSANLNLYLDDLMFFASGLTQEQLGSVKENKIVWLSGPIANWEFNDNLVDTVTNQSFAIYTGRNILFKPDRNGQANSAVYFVNEYLVISSCPQINFLHNTFMFWIYSTSDIYQNIFQAAHKYIFCITHSCSGFTRHQISIRIFSYSVTRQDLVCMLMERA